MDDSRLARLFPTPRAINNVEHEKSELFSACLSLLGKGPNGIGYFVPGRIELFGKHTDYCGGRSLLCAIDRGFAVLARPRSDNRVRVFCSQGISEFSLARDLTPSVGHWSNYPMTVARRVASNFGPD